MSVFSRDQPFELLPDGSVAVALRDEEFELLRQLPDELRNVYESPDPGDGVDPVRARLFPRAYLDPTEDRAEEEWQALVAPDLLRTRLDALAAITGGLERATRRRGRRVFTLEPDAVQQWLAVLNDARLALGVRLEITEDTDYGRIDPDAPDAFGFAVYGWLSAFQGELLEILLGDGDDPFDADPTDFRD